MLIDEEARNAVIVALVDEVNESGTQERFAQKIGVTPMMISRTLRSMTAPSQPVLDYLGFESVPIGRKISFRRIGGVGE